MLSSDHHDNKHNNNNNNNTPITKTTTTLTNGYQINNNVEQTTKVLNDDSTNHFVGALNTRRLGKRYKIKLEKSNQGGFGIKIAERDNMYGTKRPIYITAITTTGSAYRDGRLKEGDMLLEINGQDLAGLSQPHVTKMLKQVPVNEPVEFVVSRQETNNNISSPLSLNSSSTNSISNSNSNNNNSTTTTTTKHNNKILINNVPKSVPSSIGSSNNFNTEELSNKALLQHYNDYQNIDNFPISPPQSNHHHHHHNNNQNSNNNIHQFTNGSHHQHDMSATMNGCDPNSDENSIQFEMRIDNILDMPIIDGPGTYVYDIPLKDTNSAGLGLSLKYPRTIDKKYLGIFIERVLSGGAAWEDGRLQPDDQILAINGINLLNIDSHDEATDILKAAVGRGIGPESSPNTIRLKIHRRDPLIVAKILNPYNKATSTNNTQKQQSSDNNHSTSTAKSSSATNLNNNPITYDMTTSPQTQASISIHSNTSSSNTLSGLSSSHNTNPTTMPMWDDDSSEGEGKFVRDGFGRQSISEKRHAQLMAKDTDTFKRIQEKHRERNQTEQEQLLKQQQYNNQLQVQQQEHPRQQQYQSHPQPQPSVMDTNGLINQPMLQQQPLPQSHIINTNGFQPEVQLHEPVPLSNQINNNQYQQHNPQQMLNNQHQIYQLQPNNYQHQLDLINNFDYINTQRAQYPQLVHQPHAAYINADVSRISRSESFRAAVDRSFDVSHDVINISPMLTDDSRQHLNSHPLHNNANIAHQHLHTNSNNYPGNVKSNILPSHKQSSNSSKQQVITSSNNNSGNSANSNPNKSSSTSTGHKKSSSLISKLIKFGSMRKKKQNGKSSDSICNDNNHHGGESEISRNMNAQHPPSSINQHRLSSNKNNSNMTNIEYHHHHQLQNQPQIHNQFYSGHNNSHYDLHTNSQLQSQNSIVSSNTMHSLASTTYDNSSTTQLLHNPQRSSLQMMQRPQSQHLTQATVHHHQNNNNLVNQPAQMNQIYSVNHLNQQQHQQKIAPGMITIHNPAPIQYQQALPQTQQNQQWQSQPVHAPNGLWVASNLNTTVPQPNIQHQQQHNNLYKSYNLNHHLQQQFQQQPQHHHNPQQQHIYYYDF